MGTLLELIERPPFIHDHEKAERDFQEFHSKLIDEGKPDSTVVDFLDSPTGVALVKAVFGSSSFLTLLILKDPVRFIRCIHADTDDFIPREVATLVEEVSKCSSEEDAMRILRLFKQKIALFIALADIGNVWDVQSVTDALTKCAEGALEGSLAFLLNQETIKGNYSPIDPHHPEKGCGYFVLGMGKFGANELNYSSDIDLIVFYEAGLAVLREGLEPSTFFVGLTRHLSKLLNDVTSDGYVFRVDLRLRPDPGATQVALSTDAGLNYYESFGQNWERAAYIKARVVAGDEPAGKSFLDELSPYIWRRYLDFAAIADVHAMKRQIHAHKGHGKIAVAGHNIKLGRGGIREIEFFAQTQQLIAGGRQPELRCRQTLSALKTLAEKNWIEVSVFNDLSESYCFLRHVEHRLQMIGDEQTHTLPKDKEALERVAHFSGFKDLETFSGKLTAHLESVQMHYGSLFEDVSELTVDSKNLVFTGDDADPATLESLSHMGYKNPEAVISTVKSWHVGRYPATRSEKARERITEVQPVLIEALSKSADPDAALIAFDRFLSELPAGIQLFSLLRNNPNLLNLISTIVGSAPRLASLLSRRAQILDSVLDPGFFGARPSEEALQKIVDDEIRSCSDLQESLDRARNVGQEQSFLIGVRVLSGTIKAEDAGEAFANLAAHLIDSLKESVEKDIESIHGKFAKGRSAVLAMGKLGGREMTASSDLDLIVIYDHDPDCIESSGPKSLSSSHYYSRLTQRLISALSVPTAQGSLYEVDMRLRPSGNAGPVATRFDGFSDYQETKAWTWEHMALTRARVVSGPQVFRDEIESAIRSILCRQRDVQKIATDVVEMRLRIAEAKASSGLWDLKQQRGGLVDLEFIAQFLQLISAREYPEVLDQNTHEALTKLSKAGVLDSRSAEILIPAAMLFNSLTQILRLCFEGEFVASEAPQGLKNLLATAADEPDFQRLEARLSETYGSVFEVFNAIIGDRA